MKLSDRFFSVTEAADHLNVSRQYILQLIKDGRLPSQKMGQQYAIRIKDYEQLARQRAQAAVKMLESLGYTVTRRQEKSHESGVV